MSVFKLLSVRHIVCDYLFSYNMASMDISANYLHLPYVEKIIFVLQCLRNSFLRGLVSFFRQAYKLFKEQMGFSKRFQTSRTPFFLLLFCAPKQVVTSVYLNTAARSYAYAVIKNIARQKNLHQNRYQIFFYAAAKTQRILQTATYNWWGENKVNFIACVPRVSFWATTKCSQWHKICLIKKPKELWHWC